MTDIYKIGMSITLANGVSAVLATIAKDLFHVEGGVKKLQNAMHGLNKTSMLVGGALGVVAGGAILVGFSKLTDKAKELSHQLVQIKKLGVDAGDFDKYREAAYKAHSQVPGATSVDALKILGTTHSMFGVEGSLKILKPLLEFQQALGNSSGNYEKAAEQMKEMIRGGELAGQFMNDQTHKVDTDKLMAFLDLGLKANSATHGMVNPHTWLMMAQQAGPMLGTMNPEGMLTMAMVGQAMGGPRAGTALQALGRQFLGYKMTMPTADALDHIGFMKREMYEDKGGRLRNKYTKDKSLWANSPFSETGNAFAKTLQEDPLKASMILMDALQKHGYKTMKEIVPMLYQILGTDTARRIEHELVRNAPQMFDEKGRIKKGMGVAASNKVQNEEDYEQVLHNYEAAKNEMLMHIGLPLMKTAIPILQEMTRVFDNIANFAKDHAQEIADLGKAFVIIGAALVGAGAIAIMAAFGTSGWVAFGIIALGGACLTWGDKIKSFLEEIPKAIANMAAALAKVLADMVKSAAGYFGFQLQNYDGPGVGGSGGGIIKASLGGGGYSGANDNGGMQPGFKSNLDRMIAGAHAAGVPLSVFSGYRSQAHQNALFAHSDGSGHWVARRSNHTRGIAADLRGDLGWAHRHASEYGLHFPMPWEKWHIEPQGSRGGHHVKPYSKPSGGGGHQNLTVMLDGEVIHRSVVKHERRATEHSHQAPSFDGYHDFSAPDGQIWAA
jgi:hypothetical protein